MYKILVIIILSLFLHVPTMARHQAVSGTITLGDTLLSVRLPEITVTAKTKSKRFYKRRQQKYNRLIHNVRKVLPYAKIAAREINEIETKLSTVQTESEKKRIIKEEYRQLMKTFKQPLMKLSVTQGKILVRLIYRETNTTSFNHIREYKGTVNAYFWQSIALLFGNNLKADYEPEGRDRGIEEIVLLLEQQLPFSK